MKAVGEIRAGVGSIVAVQALVAFAAIGLLVRMSPAVEHVLVDDMGSAASVVRMQSALALRDCGLPVAEAEDRFAKAVSEARATADAPGEAALVTGLEPSWRYAMAGNCDARESVVNDLHRLTDLNQQHVAESAVHARQLGAAGAWATALLGIVMFAMSALVVQRFTQRIALPLSEIEAVLLAACQGDPYRRCRRLDGPAEYAVIAARLNQLLDRRLARQEEEDPQLRANDRALLVHLLERIKEPMVAVDRSGAVVAANDLAMEVLAGSGIDSLADALKVGPDGDPESSFVTGVEAWGKGQGFLVRLKPLPDDPGTEEQMRAMATGSLLNEELPAPPARRFTAEAFSDGPSSAKVVPPSPRDPNGKPDWERD